MADLRFGSADVGGPELQLILEESRRLRRQAQAYWAQAQASRARALELLGRSAAQALQRSPLDRGAWHAPAPGAGRRDS